MKNPTNVPGTSRSLAMTGATTGNEYAAIVARLCVARVAMSGSTGNFRLSRDSFGRGEWLTLMSLPLPEKKKGYEKKVV
jgi:hypothetical protein